MAVRAIRGATRAAEDSKAAIGGAVVELLSEIFSKNSLAEAQLISILFTATKDLVSEFPATAARQLGLKDTPLICAQEIDVQGAMDRVIRVLIHADSDLAKGEISHIYLRGTQALRKDLEP